MKKKKQFKLCTSHVMPTKSCHPDIDHIKDSGLKSLPYRTSLKLASSGPKEKDLFILLTRRQNVSIGNKKNLT